METVEQRAWRELDRAISDVHYACEEGDLEVMASSLRLVSLLVQVLTGVRPPVTQAQGAGERLLATRRLARAA